MQRGWPGSRWSLGDRVSDMATYKGLPRAQGKKMVPPVVGLPRLFTSSPPHLPEARAAPHSCDLSKLSASD